MVLGGPPWVAEQMWWVQDALLVAKELDAVLLNQLPMAHPQAMDLLSWIKPCWFLALDALAVVQLVKMQTFAIALATKPNAHHAAVFRAIICN